MKRYVKPAIIYESFELSQNIATCSYDVTFTDYENTCVAEPTDDAGMFPVILFANEKCEYIPGDGDSYCYESSSAEWGLFNS